ncbi:stage IV sporulation protein FB [Ruminiclostridium sufflavum DSM 19573]|uniref:Stage IV sporulation protein FB n=1 Tax=Ruminiclostridium sufflavum DSM 19573 TaxID=1121337 RepID=A0A318Y5M7_9FIRM|nr:site-2 protease family protein [Ruminiclostridium sufflavum]PYG87296.1 stage IV sporulation protein FB [Ruminiclostridium sufflavum DSM 19573]
MTDLSVKFKIKHILFSIDILIIPVIAIAFLSGAAVQYFLTIGFIITHELGHIAAAKISGGVIYSFRILSVGVNAAIEEKSCGRLAKVLIYLAGPTVNIVFAIAIYFLSACHLIPVKFAAGFYINIWLAFFNLLPILPLDGGKIAMEALSDCSGLFKAGKYMNILTVLLACVFILFGLIFFKNALFNASMILVGIYILLLRAEGRKEAAFMNIKNLLFRRSRVIKRRIYPVREIAVMKSAKLSELVKAMDYANMFHIVNVLDENLKIIKVMSEQEILDAIISGNINATVEELLSD